ncbi:MAG: N-acetylneuraminate synthase [Nitrospinae bacterium]|nr:N-acetylneuraminate synthase [Nitrospinota bacterium]
MNIKIGNRVIGEGHPVFIVAEIGVNHNGDPLITEKLIRAAADAGVDAVKFQTFKAEDLVAVNTPKDEYMKKETGSSESMYEMFKRLELPQDSYKSLKALAESMGLIFFSSPFSESAVDFLFNLDVKVFKIASAEITNLPLLRYIGRKGLPAILSTGMSTMDEVKMAVKTLEAGGCKNIVLLHATISHPAKKEDLNLRAIGTLKNEFKFPVGYSDHTDDIFVPSLAVASGAVLIEKHFTLNKLMDGPDHCHSMNPKEMADMVRMIRDTEKILGLSDKTYVKAEEEVRVLARRSLIAKRDISKGTRIAPSMITAKRPGTGIAPLSINEVLGKVALIDINSDETIKWDMIG